jgi:hypothetical protein
MVTRFCYLVEVLDRYLLLYFLEFGIWIILLPAEFRMQIHTEVRGIPRNSGHFYCKKYRGIPRNSVGFSKNSVFRRKSKTHFRGHPTPEGHCPYPILNTEGTWRARKERQPYGSPRNSAEFRAFLLQKIPRNSVGFSKNSVFRRKSKTHFRGQPTPEGHCPYPILNTEGTWRARKERQPFLKYLHFVGDKRLRVRVRSNSDD